MKDDKRRSLLKALGFGTVLLLPLRKSLTQCVTTSDILGPFYEPNMPFQDQFHPDDATGTLLYISGKVWANDCETPVSNAEVDVWAADDDGEYHDDMYRGIVRTDTEGYYQFVTIYPGKYLNGNQFRPSHLHYKVRKKDVELTTQIYFEGDTSIPADPWASDPDAKDRIIETETDNDGAIHGVADIYLDIDPIILGFNEEENRNSHLVNLSDDGTMKIFIKQRSKVLLNIYSLNGEVILEKNYGLLNNGVQRISIPIDGQKGIQICQLIVDNKLVDTKRFVFV